MPFGLSSACLVTTTLPIPVTSWGHSPNEKYAKIPRGTTDPPCLLQTGSSWKHGRESGQKHTCSHCIPSSLSHAATSEGGSACAAGRHWVWSSWTRECPRHWRGWSQWMGAAGIPCWRKEYPDTCRPPGSAPAHSSSASSWSASCAGLGWTNWTRQGHPPAPAALGLAVLGAAGFLSYWQLASDALSLLLPPTGTLALISV